MKIYNNGRDNSEKKIIGIKYSFFDIKEKAAFEMLQQRKLRQISNKDMH